MTRRRKIVFIAALVAMLGVFAWALMQPREPVYQGKTLSEWLVFRTHGTNVPDYKRLPMAEEAIQHIGTNGIPTFIRLLRTKDSRLKQTLIAFALKAHVIKQAPIPSREWNYLGYFGFNLVPEARAPAVPQLVKMLDEDISTESKMNVCAILAQVGPAASNAMPALLRLAQTEVQSPSGRPSRDPDIEMAEMVALAARNDAISAIGRIHTQPDLAVPLLIKHLDSADAITQQAAVMALAEYGPDAKPAIPSLIQLLKNGPVAPDVIVGHLLTIDPQTDMASVVLALRDGMENPAPTHRYSALVGLEMIGPKVDGVVPAMTAALRDSNSSVRYQALDGFVRFGAETKSAVPELVKMLRDPDPIVSSAALQALQTIDPETAAKFATNNPPEVK